MRFNDPGALHAFLQSEQRIMLAQTEHKTVVIEGGIAKASMGADQETWVALKALMQQGANVLFEIDHPTVQDLDSLVALEMFPAEVICSADVTTKLLKPAHAQLRERLKCVWPTSAAIFILNFRIPA